MDVQSRGRKAVGHGRQGAGIAHEGCYVIGTRNEGESIEELDPAVGSRGRLSRKTAIGDVTGSVGIALGPREGAVLL